MDLSAFRGVWAKEEEVVSRGIRAHRMGEGRVRVVGADGKGVAGARVAVRQKKHDFLFGCGAFELGQYRGDEMEGAWERAFVRLFNQASAPLCRDVYEPAAGRFLFEDDGTEIPRRPAVDRVRHWSWMTGLHTRGAPLVSGACHPAWAAAQSRAEAMEGYRAWFRAVADFMGGPFEMYDVVADALRHPKFPLDAPDLSYVEDALAAAAEIFPASAKLCLAEGGAVNRRGETADRYFALARRVLERGIRLDGLGMQFRVAADEELVSPGEMRAVYERYASLGVPMYVEDVAIPSARGEAAQAEVARDLYRFWFSLPCVAGISWGDFSDGDGALLDGALREKPAYQALYQLIAREWTTNADGETDADGVFSFRGFFGEYEATIQMADGRVETRTFHVAKDAEEPNEAKVELAADAARAEIRWVDASTLTVEGRPFAGGLGPRDALGPWARLPRDLAAELPSHVREMSHNSTGVLVRFAPDCKQWTLRARVARDEGWIGRGTGMLVLGFDVYSRAADGSFYFHENVAPSAFTRRLGALEVEHTFEWTAGLEAWIYFPCAARVWSCEIGVPAGARLAPPAPRASGVTLPVVHYGTSIGHGAFASRSALCHVAVAGRLADVPMVNLGFSGSARLELAVAKAMARIPASLYIVDPCWNATDEEMDERFKPFVRCLLASRPETPILLPAPCSCEFQAASAGVERAVRVVSRTKHLVKIYAELREEFPNAPLHYLSNEEMIPQTTDATCDHAHPNDVGHRSMGIVFAKAIREILGLV